MPKLRDAGIEKTSFTIRFDVPTLARIDAYAARTGVTRAEATRAALAAGIEALEPGGADHPATLADILQRLDALAEGIDALPDRVPPLVHRRQGERRAGTRPDSAVGKRREDKPQP